MSHLLEEYAKNLGVKVSKPIVQEHFYPLLDDKYIIICGEDRVQSKYYKHYPLVLGLSNPILKKNNIKVYQLGGKEISGVDKLLNLDFKKSAYAISRCMLYIGPDNELSQYASSQSVNTLTLFGNCYAQNSKPFWDSEKSTHINLEPKWDSKPCFSTTDYKEQINSIKPEVVSSHIINLCGLEDEEVEFKTKNIGKHFYQNITEVIPTQISQLNIPKEIFLRVDYGFDEEAFMHYCLNHKVTMVTDKLIQPSTLNRISGNISKILYTINKDLETIPQKYFDILKGMGIPITLLSEKKEDLNFLRNKYFEIPVQLRKEEKEKISCSPESRFLSNKNIVEGNKVYKSYAHYKKGLDSDENVLDTPEYWEELEHFCIYEQKENSKKSEG